MMTTVMKTTMIMAMMMFIIDLVPQSLFLPLQVRDGDIENDDNYDDDDDDDNSDGDGNDDADIIDLVPQGLFLPLQVLFPI